MANRSSLSIIRDFGDWVLVRDGIGTQTAYLNKVSGEMFDDPPQQVLDTIFVENAKTRLPVYEPTPHHFNPLPVGEQSHSVREEQLLDRFGDNAVVLHDFLSPSECESIIAQAEAFGLQSCGYSRSMRITDRVSVMGEELARLLFERAKPFLRPIEVKREKSDSTPFGVRHGMAKGLWLPTGLNPCFRVCRYQRGGFFQPHHDGGFDFDSRHRSIKTFMVYLNDGFKGGPTTFYEESQRHYAKPDRRKALYDFKPQTGAALMFNHAICHDGGILESGTKYLLRTEVMYQLSLGQVERFPSTQKDDVDSDFSDAAQGEEEYDN